MVLCLICAFKIKNLYLVEYYVKYFDVNFKTWNFLLPKKEEISENKYNQLILDAFIKTKDNELIYLLSKELASNVDLNIIFEKVLARNICLYDKKYKDLFQMVNYPQKIKILASVYGEKFNEKIVNQYIENLSVPVLKEIIINLNQPANLDILKIYNTFSLQKGGEEVFKILGNINPSILAKRDKDSLNLLEKILKTKENELGKSSVQIAKVLIDNHIDVKYNEEGYGIIGAMTEPGDKKEEIIEYLLSNKNISEKIKQHILIRAILNINKNLVEWCIEQNFNTFFYYTGNVSEVYYNRYIPSIDKETNKRLNLLDNLSGGYQLKALEKLNPPKYRWLKEKIRADIIYERATEDDTISEKYIVFNKITPLEISELFIKLDKEKNSFANRDLKAIRDILNIQEKKAQECETVKGYMIFALEKVHIYIKSKNFYEKYFEGEIDKGNCLVIQNMSDLKVVISDESKVNLIKKE